MSRSRRKVPASVYGKAGGMKLAKRHWNKKIRQNARQIFHHSEKDEIIIPHRNGVTSIYNCPRDGHTHVWWKHKGEECADELILWKKFGRHFSAFSKSTL